MWKIQITTKDGSVKVTEVNRNILEALNSCSLKTRKPFDFKHLMSYSLSPVPLSICKPDGTRRHTPKKQIEIYFTVRSTRSYQRRTTVFSRICNSHRYDCFNKYDP